MLAIFSIIFIKLMQNSFYQQWSFPKIARKHETWSFFKNSVGSLSKTWTSIGASSKTPRKLGVWNVEVKDVDWLKISPQEWKFWTFAISFFFKFHRVIQAFHKRELCLLTNHDLCLRKAIELVVSNSRPKLRDLSTNLPKLKKNQTKHPVLLSWYAVHMGQVQSP